MFCNKKLIFCMKIFHGKTYLPFHITIPKRYDIEKIDDLNIIVSHWIQLVRKYAWERTDYFISTMMVNYIYIIYEMFYPVIKKFISSFHWMHWNESERNIWKWMIFSNFLEEPWMVVGCYRKSSLWWMYNINISRKFLKWYCK